MSKRSLALYAIIFIAIFSADRITKSWVIEHPNYWQVTSWLSCDLSYNRGIAGGFLQSPHALWYGILTAFIIFFIIGFVLDMVRGFRNNHSLYGQFLVLAGAFSNIYDRFAYSGVVDFISCSYAGWYFPTFNVADAAIVCGVIIMIVSWYEYS